MKSCVFPGSFDPPTCGHMELIRRASKLFDSVTVAVMVNRSKKGIIPLEERVRMLRKACGDCPGVRVELWEGLLADYIRIHPGCAVIRGIRGADEYEREASSAAVNRILNPEMETVFLPAAGDTASVSSSAVREVASFGGNYSAMVPAVILEDVDQYMQILSRKDK